MNEDLQKVILKEYRYYEFQIKKNGKTTKKYFKLLDEAVKYRNEWIRENAD